jgi:multicomponent Na+:H+ antiporter subunit G
VTVVVGLLLLGGLFFQAVAALGVVRMPDVYTRLHALSKAETLGMLLTLAAVAVAAGPGLTSVKVALVAAFLFLANPTATHAISRAALRLHVSPWQRSRQAGR